LRRDGRRLGLLELRQRRDGRAFDEDDRARAEAIAAELAGTIDPGTLAHDVESLYRVFGAIDGIVPSEAMALILEPEHGQELVVTSSRVLRPGVVDGLRLRAGQGIAGWVARNRQTVCVDDARVDPRHDPSVSRRTGLVARSMISVPLVDRDALLGVLQVINKEGAQRFTQDDVRLVESLAIAHAQLYRRAEIASFTDDLTGLGNTRRFNAVLPAALARGGPVSLLVLDLDALKSIVDRDGHLVGSRAIATVGRLISEQLRPGDSAARFGGDEFVAVLPETSTDDAVAIAQRIRAAVQASTTPDDVVADVSMLTASIGVATFPVHGIDAETLFRAADRALYRIKFGGKNGVAIAQAEA